MHIYAVCRLLCQQPPWFLQVALPAAAQSRAGCFPAASLCRPADSPARRCAGVHCPGALPLVCLEGMGAPRLAHRQGPACHPGPRIGPPEASAAAPGAGSLDGPLHGCCPGSEGGRGSCLRLVGGKPAVQIAGSLASLGAGALSREGAAGGSSGLPACGTSAACGGSLEACCPASEAPQAAGVSLKMGSGRRAQTEGCCLVWRNCCLRTAWYCMQVMAAEARSNQRLMLSAWRAWQQLDRGQQAKRSRWCKALLHHVRQVQAQALRRWRCEAGLALLVRRLDLAGSSGSPEEAAAELEADSMVVVLSRLQQLLQASAAPAASATGAEGPAGKCGAGQGGGAAAAGAAGCGYSGMLALPALPQPRRRRFDCVIVNCGLQNSSCASSASHTCTASLAKT